MTTPRKTKSIPLTVLDDATLATRERSPSQGDGGKTVPRVRPSRMGKWRALSLILVHVLIAAHITHWLIAGETMTPLEPSEAMAFSRDSVINAGLLFFAAMVLLTAVFGRFFCGWGCHVLALQDYCRHLMLKLGITPKPLNSRTLAWVPTLAFLYMFIWPLAFRIWHGDDLSVRAVELTTEHFWATFPGWTIGVLTLLICGFACVYLLGAKGFCTYACPYGAVFAAADRIAPLRIRVTDACHQCGHCTAVCSSNVRVHEEVRTFGMVVSPGCMKCQDCVSVCPKGALYYGSGPIPLVVKPRFPVRQRSNMPWRDEAVLVLVFAFSFLSLRGLYGIVPFLMALGLAAVLAFWALTQLQIWHETTVVRSGWALKRTGKLTRAGLGFTCLSVLLTLTLVHSAWLRWQESVVERDFQRLDQPRLALLAEPWAKPALSPELRELAEETMGRLRQIDEWTWFDGIGNAGRSAWLQVLLGDAHTDERAINSGITPELDALLTAAANRFEWPEQMEQLKAHLALHAEQHGRAVAAWRAAVKLAPQRPEAYLAWGLHHARNGELIAAQAVFDQGVLALSDHPELQFNAGLARALSGQPEAAIEHFERALRINPRYREARENLAGVFASLGQFEAAQSHFLQALELAPEDHSTRVLLARVLVARGDLAGARRELGKVLTQVPNHVEAGSMMRSLGADAVNPQ